MFGIYHHYWQSSMGRNMVLRPASSLLILRAMLLVPLAFSCNTVAADAANIIPFAAYRREGRFCESVVANFLTHKHWDLKEVRTINEKVNLRNQRYPGWLLRPH